MGDLKNAIIPRLARPIVRDLHRHMGCARRGVLQSAFNLFDREPKSRIIVNSAFKKLPSLPHYGKVQVIDSDRS